MTDDGNFITESPEMTFLTMDFQAAVRELESRPATTQRFIDEARTDVDRAEIIERRILQPASTRLQVTIPSHNPRATEQTTIALLTSWSAMQSISRQLTPVELVMERSSEIAEDLAYSDNYENPLESPPIVYILELYDWAKALVRTVRGIENMARVTVVLKRLIAQIRRMEDLIVEHRLPDTDERSFVLLYLERPL
jgi:hypothetical protein